MAPYTIPCAVRGIADRIRIPRTTDRGGGSICCNPCYRWNPAGENTGWSHASSCNKRMSICQKMKRAGTSVTLPNN